jgi:hypothetical protein
VGDGIIVSDLDYLTLAEQRMFSEARKAGRVSFFQTSSCKVCGKDIPKTPIKKYCSEKCSTQDKETSDAESSAQDDGDGEVDR